MKTRIPLCIFLIAGGFLLLACGLTQKLTATKTPKPTATPSCLLVCNIDTESYSLEVSCEHGSVNTEYKDQMTEYVYNDSGMQTGLKVHVNQVQTYTSSGNAYTITGLIELNQVENTVSYEISAAGGQFGNTPQTCKQGSITSESVATAPPPPPTEWNATSTKTIAKPTSTNGIVTSTSITTNPIAGEWAGTIANADGSFSTLLELSILEGCRQYEVCGTFDTPQLSCSGSLLLVKIDAGTFEFAEEEISGASTCAVGGYEYLQLQEDGRLLYQFSLGQGADKISSGMLIRQ